MEWPTSALFQTAIYGHWLKVESFYGQLEDLARVLLLPIFEGRRSRKNTRCLDDKFFLRDRNRQSRSTVPGEFKSASAFVCDACVDDGRLCITKLAGEQFATCRAIGKDRRPKDDSTHKLGQSPLYVIEENRLRFEREFIQKATNGGKPSPNFRTR